MEGTVKHDRGTGMEVEAFGKHKEVPDSTKHLYTHIQKEHANLRLKVGPQFHTCSLILLTRYWIT